MIEDYYGLAKRDILVPSNAAPIDRKLTFDKVTGAHYSGTHHDENQPVHLLVQTDVCHYDLRPRIRAPVRQVLSGQRLRNGRQRRGRPAAADQRLELRALQDVRHHGSLRRDHLGRA